MEGTLGEIRMYAGSVLPSGWKYCDGQTLPISGNQALYDLLGTTFGGDGLTDFGLPDMRGRVPAGVGQGTGLSNITIGESDGNNDATLSTANLPAHNHAITGSVTPQASTDGALTATPNGRHMGPGTFYSDPNELAAMAPIPATGLSSSNTGSGTDFSLMQPYLGVHFIICVSGPSPSLIP